MKKVLSLFAGVCLSASLFAQLTPGSTAPNWTFTDLNGNSWSLYTETAAGRTVFIDVSATWCGPCWNYHNTHALRDIYDEYGPTGTIMPNQLMVFFIEGDAATTIADLNGTGSNTQGNWVSGTTYPIIDPGAQTNTFNSNYAIGYFPTIYKVCPDNKIYEVGQVNAQALLNSINGCTFATDAFPSAGPTMTCSTTFSPVVEITNNGQSTMTSVDITYSYDAGSPATYNWTGSLAAGASTNVTLPSNTFTGGAHVAHIATSNPNGGTDNNNINNSQDFNFTVMTAAGTPAPYTNNCSVAGFPYANWNLNNPDNSTTWARVSTNGGSLKLDCYNYGSVGEVDEFTVEPIDLSSASAASVSFNVAHARYSASYTDALEVLVSSDCGATWTSVWAKSGTTLATAANTTAAFTPTANQWRAECIDLTTFSGNNKVFVMFRSTNGYGNNIYVDDINVTTSACPTGIADVTNDNNLSIYPNPANSSVNMNFNLVDRSEVTVNVYNTLGEVVYTEYKGSMVGQNIVTINTENFSNGMYMVELVAGDTKTVTRMNVSH
jgi:hypothetical protein